MYVQIGGGAMRLPAAKFRARADESTKLMKLILRHAQVISGQVEQTVACNGMHHLPERLARWLLISHDRVGSDTMLLTQDYMAVMTGALRSSISLAANARQKGQLGVRPVDLEARPGERRLGHRSGRTAASTTRGGDVVRRVR